MSSDVFLSSCRLGDIGEFKNGANFSQEDYGPGYPIVNVKQLYGGRYVELQGLESLGKEVLRRPEQLFLAPGDILFARSSVKRSGAGQCALVPDGVADTIFSGFIIRYRLSDKSATNPMFLSYLLQSPVYREIFPRIATGTTISNLSQDALKGVEVNLPDKATQDQVAEMLGAFDDRITLLRETNATLEAIAQALFKSWFVDFDPVRAKMAGRAPEGLDEATGALFPDALEETELGLVPKGWSLRPFIESVDVIGGGTPKTSNPDFWGGDIPWFSVVDAPSGADTFVVDTEKRITEAGLKGSSTKLLPQGTTIISARGTVGKLALTGCPMAMNQSCYGLRGKAGDSYFTYFSTCRLIDALKARSHGSVFDTITRDTLASVQSLIPSTKDVITAFEATVKPLMDRILLNLHQSRSLVDLRDSLLPRLVSGQLRLPEAMAELDAASVDVDKS